MGNGGGGFLTILGFLFLGFVGFMIYFTFKALQFVIQAVDLYKDMVRRLDKIIELLSSRAACNPSVTAFGNVAQPLSDVEKIMAKPNKCIFCGVTINQGEIKCEECKKK